MNNERKIGAIVLAAGKGKRMKSKSANKVTLQIGDKPLILRIVERLEELSITPIVVVVGFAKESVIKILGSRVIYAEQAKRLGTAHAAIKGLQKLPKGVTDVLLIYGDEFSYPKEKTQELIDVHVASDVDLSFLTIEKDDPFGLGRIIRDKKGNVIKIVEEKDATDEERSVKEVNPGCYVCKVSFLKKYLPKIKKSVITGEYYVTDLIGLAINNKTSVGTVKAGNMLWQGVNTQQELEEAQQLFKTI